MLSSSDFPVFSHNPELIYLDGASTSPKPSYVIDGVNDFLIHEYANIHRGQYSLALKAEARYRESKQKIAQRIHASPEEIIFTANSTASSNLLVDLIRKNHLIKSGEVILLSIAEHHANIVPRQMLCEEVGCRIEWIMLDHIYQLDIQDFCKKYTDKVKIVAVSEVSNVTGSIYTLSHIKEKLRPDTLFIVDGSQSIPHISVDVQALGCDFWYCTGHKLYAYTGVGILYGKKSLLKVLQPSQGGGGMIQEVTQTGYTLQSIPDKFEAGTPNLIGIVSILKALEYIEQGDGYIGLHAVEFPLVQTLCSFFEQHTQQISLIGTTDPLQRVGVFSFTIPGYSMVELGQYFATNHICVRAGAQCAHPLHHTLHIVGGTCRVSIGARNTLTDIHAFIDMLEIYMRKPSSSSFS